MGAFQKGSLETGPNFGHNIGTTSQKVKSLKRLC